MTVEIPSDLEQFVHRIVADGSYKSEAEAVSQALRLLENRQRRIDELRREIQPALDQLDRGEGLEIRNEEELRLFFEGVKERGRQRREAKHARQ